MNVFDRYNITYFLSDGTLLGSYFYHDMLPWDDDLDIRVAYDDYPKLKRVVYQNPSIRKYIAFHGWGDGKKDEFNDDELGNIYKDTRVETVNGMMYSSLRLHRHKWNFVNQKKTFDYPWRWPFIDIFFLKQNATHAWTLDSDRFTFYFRLSDIYPLHLRPFMSMWVPAPRDTKLFLQKKYKTFVCRSHVWDHIHERGKIPTTRPCQQLESVYPYVERRHFATGSIEELIWQGESYYRTYVDESVTGSAQAYSLT